MVLQRGEYGSLNSRGDFLNGGGWGSGGTLDVCVFSLAALLYFSRGRAEVGVVGDGD